MLGRLQHIPSPAVGCELEEAIKHAVRYSRRINGKWYIPDKAFQRFRLDARGTPIEGSTTIWWRVDDYEELVGEFYAELGRRRKRAGW